MDIGDKHGRIYRFSKTFFSCCCPGTNMRMLDIPGGFLTKNIFLLYISLNFNVINDYKLTEDPMASL